MILLLLLGCLERVTGQPEPLDPRYTEGMDGAAAVEHHEMPPGAPGGPSIGHSGGPDPFDGHDGPRVRVSGEISAGAEVSLPEGAGVGIGLFVPDDSPIGRRLLGRIEATAGPYSFDAPAGMGELIVEALVDPDGDGPTSGDLLGQPKGGGVVVGDAQLVGVNIELSALEMDEPTVAP